MWISDSLIEGVFEKKKKERMEDEKEKIDKEKIDTLLKGKGRSSRKEAKELDSNNETELEDPVM